MMRPASEQLAQLNSLTYADLRARCADRELEALPARLSPELMRHLLAHAIQREISCKLPSAKIPSEGAIQRALERGLSERSATAVPMVQSGSVLTRDWKGTRHTVHVSEDGYEWNGETYRSLSKIAQLITGTRWSGPRFFGVQS
ncbi:MAG: DUF2924 domain-containing protein [Pseudomonadota bacterium]